MDELNWAKLERDFTRPELNRGDTIFQWGRFEPVGWKFFGIGRFGISYYLVTGDEDETQRTRLENLVRCR